MWGFGPFTVMDRLHVDFQTQTAEDYRRCELVTSLGLRDGEMFGSNTIFCLIAAQLPRESAS